MRSVRLPNGVSMATEGARPCVAVSNTQGCFLSVEELGALAGGKAVGRRAANSGRVTVISSGFPPHFSIQRVVSAPSTRPLSIFLSVKSASPASSSLPQLSGLVVERGPGCRFDS